MDTDVLIDLERKHPPADAWFAALPHLPAIPGFAAMELLNGSRSQSDRLLIETFLRPFSIVWPTEADMDRALRKYTPLRLSDGLGLIDALIAATAVGRGEALLTFKVKHYRAVPGLAIHQPYIR